MSISNNSIFNGLKIIVWVIFIGLCIEVGGLLTNFGLSLMNKGDLITLYSSIDLRELYEQSQWAFFSATSLVISIAGIKAYLFYLLLKLVNAINLEHPFTPLVAKQISQLSYYTISIGLLSYLMQRTIKGMQKQDLAIDSLTDYASDASAYVLMAAVIYTIGVIFKKGVEFQEEVEETV